MKRNNFTEDEALIRMKAQLPQEEKILKSDYVIYNNSTKDELNKQLSYVVWSLLLKS